MIPGECIREWRPEHPWTGSAGVEQDLIISRTIVSIFSDPFLTENLAFRGGTALHKLHLPFQVRYSEDIDLVQIKPGPMREIMDHLIPRADFNLLLRIYGTYIRRNPHEKRIFAQHRP